MNQKKKPKKRIAVSILFTFLVTLGVLLSTSCHWALSQFADLNMEEIVYELSTPLEGTGNGMIENYLLHCALPAAVTLPVCILIAVFIRKKRWFGRVAAVLILAGCAAIAAPAAVFWNSTNIGEYLSNINVSSDFIETNYVNPKDVTLTFPEEKRNLIFLYLESMEISFSDYENGGASDTNYIPELTELAMKNENFSGNSGKLNGGYSMPSTTWTIGGIFASTAGLPLKGGVDNNDMSKQESFFPNLRTLGNILEDEGYAQTFICGSDASFGGRRLYFTEHGNYDFLDVPEAKAEGLIPQNYNVFWGFEDQKMFDMAKDRITETAKGDQPFNITMLTVDTHTPNGYACPLCEDEYEDFEYGNAVSCSSRQVEDFIEWAEEQSWYDDTTIVIVGDHPTMATVMADRLDGSVTRKTYACYINAAAETENPDAERTYTTFDTFPTTLAALGVEIPGNRLGLGTNLFSATQTLSEQYGYETESAELSKQSDALNELEAPDKETQELMARYADEEVNVAVDPSQSLIQFISPDMSEDKDNISGMSVRLWFDDNEQYVHTVIPGTLQWDGTYKFAIANEYYFNADELHYQMLAQTSGGSISICDEGIMDPKNYDPYGSRNPVKKYAAESGQETIVDTFKKQYLTEWDIDTEE